MSLNNLSHFARRTFYFMSSHNVGTYLLKKCLKIFLHFIVCFLCTLWWIKKKASTFFAHFCCLRNEKLLTIVLIYVPFPSFQVSKMHPYMASILLGDILAHCTSLCQTCCLAFNKNILTEQL